MKSKINEIKNTYICHNCIDYVTTELSDMIRHFKRKNKCKCNYIFSYDDATKLSRRKYQFNIDIKNLTRDDYIFIIKNYTDPINYIDSDYRTCYKKINNTNNNDTNNNNTNNNDLNNNTTSIKIDDINSITNLKDIMNYNINDIVKLFKNYPLSQEMNLNKIDETNNDINNKSIIPISEKTLNNEYGTNIRPIDINTKLTKMKYYNVFFNDDTQNYVCGTCKAEYTHLDSLKRHNKRNTCAKRKKILDISSNCNQMIDTIVKKEEEKNAIHNMFINQNNIQNNNNKNSNTNNNTYHLDIKDFVHDRYDLSHIKNNFYEQKDFFLYHNFLRAIMENKRNQNIYFSNGEAVIYSDNELYKMNSDKAGYMILDKLSDSFDQLFYNQDEETRKCYEFIKKYYHVIKGHYKHDTIHKDYDVDERKFIYTASSNLFRSRDKYLGKMIGALNSYKNSARENMLINLDEINDIQMLNPSIEDFASTKMRYRDLRDKD